MTKSPLCTIYNTMMNKITLTIIVLLGFSLALPDLGLWAGTAGIIPGAKVRQEKTEKKEEEKKQEGEKKKEEKKIKRIWTDKDLKEIRKKRVNITEVPTDPDEKKKKGKKKVTDPPDLVKDKMEGSSPDPKKTEKYWRGRKKALVDKIEKNKAEIEKLEKRLLEVRLKLLGGHFDSPHSHSEIVALKQELQDSTKKLQNYKKGLERMKQELEDLYEEARKAGALPGWLRD